MYTILMHIHIHLYDTKTATIKTYVKSNRIKAINQYLMLIDSDFVLAYEIVLS